MRGRKGGAGLTGLVDVVDLEHGGHDEHEQHRIGHPVLQAGIFITAPSHQHQPVPGRFPVQTEWTAHLSRNMRLRKDEIALVDKTVNEPSR